MTAPPRQKRPPRPLDPARLDELALAYVARFAVSAAKLETYLKRKLAERGWAEPTEPPVNAVVARFIAAGYVDDAAYARMKAGSLRRRGYGQRRIGQALEAAGIDAGDRAAVIADERTQREAILILARRRRLGPWGPSPDRAGRERQLGTLLRAGHRPDHARAVLDAEDPAAAEAWLAEVPEREDDA